MLYFAMFSNKNISSFFSEAPIGIALCDVSLIKEKFSGMTEKNTKDNTESRNNR